MFEIVFYSVVIFGGAIIYNVMGGQPSRREEKVEPKKKNNEKDTYDYFCKLPINEQKQYFDDNYDLRYYKNDKTVGVTDDKHINARHAEEISRRTGKSFTNRFKTY